MKNLTSSILLVVALMLLPGCAITHEFGPYTGKVIDKETGAPIVGAVVFLRFYTGTIWAVGGRVSHYADAVEYLTDNEGKFDIPVQRVFTFIPGDTWDQRPLVIIFKPGYGAYPDHPDTSDGNTPTGWLQVGDNAIKLPKLKTRGELERNIGYSGAYHMREVPCAKQRHILKLNNSVATSLGFEPEMTDSCGDIDHEN